MACRRDTDTHKKKLHKICYAFYACVRVISMVTTHAEIEIYFSVFVRKTCVNTRLNRVLYTSVCLELKCTRSPRIPSRSLAFKIVMNGAHE